MTPNDLPLVKTIGERCRTCYSCVRGCPAKAIRIVGGQAEVIAERCIGCGNCVITCGRKAKEIRSSVENTQRLLKSGGHKAACLAPSFPVEFGGMDPLRLAGMLKALGFDYVTEVAFGADMVSLRCRELISECPGKRFISSACPAVVAYVEKYHPELVSNLAPVVSPMLAQARIVRKGYGAEVKVVFIGPCIAKKDEAFFNSVDIEEAITFKELRQLFELAGITEDNALDAHFDPPHPAKGVLYPLGGGLLNASEFDTDLMSGKFLAVEGLENMTEALSNFERGELDVNFLDILCCDGCLMGPGFTHPSSRYARQASLRRYAQKSYYNFKVSEWEKDLQRFRALNYSCSFRSEDKRLQTPAKKELEEI
ncbi:MAG TPA: [Fe-Fe] hydrogenase large subunit C-terminal domain-containing protein, partial [Elusimicrobiales bacterium]|nr:[Fe-Fe] hydrogenase large subunit C-terminal domain-containing protein [Elusimicrobiales bacterium]